ncbi:MAG: ABC transporter ATP-binding protein [Acidimicrobiales bacterium]
MTNAVEVRDLVKRYRRATANAVDGISFDVAEGQLFCLLGPNGAGKTTTVSILTTTLQPTSGEVVIAGKSLAVEPRVLRRQLGIVFQQPSLDLNLTAEENIRLHAVLYGLYPWRPAYRLMAAAYRQQVGELAEVLGVADVLHRPARMLSGGTRRKLEIVRALLHHPPVLFLDEPTTGLDPESRRNLWDYLRLARSQSGTTLFLTTHYLEEAEAADAVCVLSRGRIVETGTPAELKARHLRPVLVLGAAAGDVAALRAELAALGLSPGPPAFARDGDGDGGAGGRAADGGFGGRLRVLLGDRPPQAVLRSLQTELTYLRIDDPTLEDAYLDLLSRPA